MSEFATLYNTNKPMTSDEFQNIQSALNLTNRDLERLFDVSDQTVVNWRKGYTRIPLAVKTLIRMWMEKGKPEL